jgi:hypothetical protein
LATAIFDAVEVAAADWEATFFDPVTVTVELDLDPGFMMGGILGPSTFAAGIPETIVKPYTDVKAALTADAKSITDLDVIGSLQPGPFLEAVVNNTVLTPSPPMRIGSLTMGGPEEDVWNSELLVPTANAKALKIPLGGPFPKDGTFLINGTLLSDFDYDSSDGVDMGKFDFETITKHELGHIMGFLSGVDSVDFAGSTPAGTFGPDHPDDLTGEPTFKVLDLFKYAPGTLMDPIQPATGKVLAWFYSPEFGSFIPEFIFFSVDGGTTISGFFESGAFNGISKKQTSHWLEGMPGPPDPGIMIADLDPETILAISGLDVVAFDAIGWDTLVPEPGAVALMLWGLVAATLFVQPRRFL